MGFDRLIEPFWKLAQARQCAMPFAFIIGEAADLPLRQLQVDQRKRRIGPCARLNQPLDAGCLPLWLVEGKRRQLFAMMSDRNSAVTV